MSKSKSKSAKGGAMPDAKVLNKVKESAITKSSQTPKGKSKVIAQEVAGKKEKKSKHKKVKEPTPEPESESEVDTGDSDSASDSDSETKTKAPVKNGTANGTAARKIVAAAKDGDSDEDSEEESASSESSGDEATAGNAPVAVPTTKKAAKVVSKIDEVTVKPGATNGTSKRAAESSEESDSSDSDEGKPASTKKPVPVVPKPASADNADDSEDSDEEEDDEEEDEDSDESSDESSEETEPKRAAIKRKAEEDATPTVKKAKISTDGHGGQGKNLFVGSLSWNVDEEWLKREFEEFGELTGVRVITDRNTGKSKGFGYIEFANDADAARAHAAKQGLELDGRRINLDFATARGSGDARENVQSRAKSFGDQPGDPTDTLWIGNISFQVDQDQLSTAFQEFGTILGVRLPTDRETGALKGFGYVTFSTVDEAKVAMEAMQGADLAGRSLRLDFSQPRQNNGDSSARGGRGGGRGGFGDRGRGGFGGRGGGRGGFGDRGGRGGGGGGGRGGGRGGRGGSTNRGGFGDFSGQKTKF